MSEQPAVPQIKPVHAIALAVVAILLAVSMVTMIWLRKPEPARTLRLEPGSGTPIGASGTPSASATTDLGARPEVQAYRDRQRFEQRIQRFVQQSAQLSDGERAATAQALEAEIGRMEAARQLSAGEAVLLRMHVVNAVGGDPGARLQRAQALALLYRRDAERRQAEFEQAQRNDPRFRSYKQREAEIVAEVQAMRSFPGGMDRDTYLRQRLQEAREAAYAQPAPAVPPQSSPPTPAPAPAPAPPTGTPPTR